MELCAYIDVVATLPQREYTCCHTQSHTHTNTLPTHLHTYALWAVAAKHARQFISLLQGAFATLFLYFHLIRSFHSIVYAQLIGWDSFKRVRVRGRGMSIRNRIVSASHSSHLRTCRVLGINCFRIPRTHARTHTECDKYEGAQRVLTAKESLDC